VSVLRRADALWLAVGAVGFALVPWYAVPGSIWSTDWILHWLTKDNAPAWQQAIAYGRAWLWPVAALLVAGAGIVARARRTARANALIAIGALGFVYTLGQGFVIGPQGWYLDSLQHALPPLPTGQYGMGFGAFLVLCAFAMLFALGLAGRAFFKGDAFIAGSAVAIALLVAVFTFFPVFRILISAAQDANEALSLTAFAHRLFTEKIWGIGCVVGSTRCGVAWNTLILAFSCAIACTGLGLAFALIWSRTAFRYKKMLRFLSVLPIITPPFVIGLGLILIFGRSGLINQLVEYAFGLQLGRWIYGYQGVLLAQVFAFTPIAFLVLVGVVEGVAPSMEEAAQTLRADRWRVFSDISLPLMRPGLANAFLISFIESIADFGNPILLSGNFGVLSTEVFFSVVGAQLDQGRAATLGILLLAFALAAFFAQRWLLGRKVYTSLAGKGESGVPTQLPDPVRRLCYGVAIPWAALTLVIYSMAMVGGFVETWGRDYTPTLKHYTKAFAIEWTSHGILWAGAAWNSFWTTIKLSALAAPLTAALGILSAYLLTRQNFKGKAAFEFGTMLSFAIPGTVIGVSYILAFNVPPIEITGTGIILIVCFLFRNMPVGVRAGIAAMSQIDRSLDEASVTLGARGFTTLRRVILPLLKPAIVAALVYSFVRAVTTVSAVIFLVSAEHEMATTYIINRVVNGDYGVAIAYCSVLIVLMLAAIWLIQIVVGERRLGRRGPVGAPAIAPVAPVARNAV
jgi:iron(III) transport system permease protein